MNTAVSVVIATRNYARFLSGAIRSVQEQTFPDWELLVIDDGSSDATPDVIRRFRDDSRIRDIRTDGLGQPRAKNLGITLSRAPLIAFLDGDDIWLPGKLKAQVELMQADPQAGVVFCRRAVMDEHGIPLPSSQPALPRGQAFERFVGANPVCFSSVMVRRELFERVGMFDSRLDLAIDYDLWLRASRHTVFNYVDEVLVRYRTGHGNLSRRLTERIASVLSTMRRCLLRRGNAKHASPPALREAWGSTYRSMAYAERSDSPARAIGWYLRAAVQDRRIWSTCRAAATTFARAMSFRR